LLSKRYPELLDGDPMGKSISSQCTFVGIALLISLAFTVGTVAASENQWPWADPQDQAIAWGKMNADANMANLHAFAASELLNIPRQPFSLSPADLQMLLDRKINPEMPAGPAPSPRLTGDDLKTIDGTPVNDLFRKAMENYQTNPPKPMTVPGPNGTIYSHQIINWQ
jgi:hypothetical protein